ncbi:Zeta toxin family protein [Kitasatospora aureofaciens]|uniref:zeta toxin family protein n=1 Tax=Streptomyces rimosus TaxID=1927 RepID=UPI0002ABA35D|nr:zeta toxin family protein [Streptomyces rimosus]KEF04810.1 Zeta toxin family protein [Streptomyces rimosus]KOG73046.1 Zeta toxin family protein [Kitasatospora aureofaciens]KUJ35099.1 Zeta toxin family protein [Streptomyces rimosus subsp. rimosus]
MSADDPADDWSQTLLTAKVLSDAVRGAAAQQHPVVVFVAGQAGSGKTLVLDLVHAAVSRRGGAVRVDRDAYKSVHPHYAGYLAEDVRTAGVRVRPQTYDWQAEVEAHARAHRYDVVAEEALADPARWRATAAAYRQAGYRIEVVALAVPEAVSQLGVLDRYLRLAEQSRARYVSWDNHDACAAALPTTLAAIEAEHLADRVVVVRRGAQVLYANELADGQWVRQPGACEALLAERARQWSAAETGAFRRQLADADRRAHDPQLPEDWSLAVRRNAERAAALAEPVRRTAQPRREAPGVDYHRLSAEEHRFIFDELIVPDLLARSTPQEQPIVVYIMGQPGAGKTAMTPMIRRTLRGRPVRISGDDFKTAHPDYLQLLREDPRTAGSRIRADYRAWQTLAEAYVRQRRSDAVVEIAPASTAAFANAAALYRQAGYRVEVVVLAVRAADSLQGTAARYAQVSRYGGPARFTTTDGHDTHFAALADAVAAAENTPVADAVTVLRRDATVIYRNERSRTGHWTRPAGAAAALLLEQTRPYTTAEAAQFGATHRWLRSAMPHYRDALRHIAGLARPLMPLHLQPHRLPGPGPVAALPLPRPGYCGPGTSSSFRRAA